MLAICSDDVTKCVSNDAFISWDLHLFYFLLSVLKFHSKVIEILRGTDFSHLHNKGSRLLTFA